MYPSPQIQARFALARLTRILALAAAIALAAACATTGAPVTAPAPGPEGWYQDALHWSRTAAEHRAIYEQTFRLAALRAGKLAEGRTPGSWGVSVDADETLIDNSRYDLETARRGEEFNAESWNEWVQQGVAPALPGAAAFTMRVQDLGGVVAVVTNRRVHQCAPTAENLRREGIAFDVVLCRAEDGEKEPRWDALSAGTTGGWPAAQFGGDSTLGPVELLMWLGDNIGDFPDLNQGIRHRAGPLHEFGDRFFALPNPMYGSWERNPKE